MELLENTFKEMTISQKMSFIIDWLTDPKGKNASCTIKIYGFKLKFLLKILRHLFSGKSIAEGISKTKKEYMNSKIETTAKNRDGYLFSILNGVNLDMLRESREEFLDLHFKPKSGDFILDIGANMGTYAIENSKIVDTGKIFAIEADPKTFNLLQKNIHLNKISNVFPINLAAFSENKEVKLYRKSNTAANSIMFEDDNSDFVTIQAVKTDDIVEKYVNQIVNWVKIDVEGAEVEVLKGGDKLLSSNDIQLIIEVHSKKNLPLVENILKKYQFQIIKSNEQEEDISYVYAKKN